MTTQTRSGTIPSPRPEPTPYASLSQNKTPKELPISQDPLGDHPTGLDNVESLIVDLRGELTPAEMVERKLISLLKGRWVPLSHVRITGLPRHRGLS
jgi:hypothetical protein